LLAAGPTISAQSAGKAPSQTPQATSAQTQQAVPTPQTPLQPVLKLADVVRKVEKEGRSTSIGSYIAEGIGIKGMQLDSSPVQAHVLDDGARELCVIDDTGALLFMFKNGSDTEVYLTNHAGVLQTAGYFYPGRFHSQDFKDVSKQKAAAGFAAEKEFWIRRISPGGEGDAVKAEEHISPPNAVRKTVAVDKAAADAGEKAKLSEMTPQERIKYLDQQMREAKQQAKLEKKESEKEKKLAGKTPAHKQDAKDDTSADKSAAANSNQQSKTDSDATPAKKKISWF
jgi:hypothetical protein